MNQLPCSFMEQRQNLLADESICFYEIIGRVENKDFIKSICSKKLDAAYFHAKAKEAEELVEHLCSGIATETASKDFDAYCQYTYMDNVLKEADIRSGLAVIRFLRVFQKAWRSGKRLQLFFHAAGVLFTGKWEISAMSTRTTDVTLSLHHLWEGRISKHFTA